MAAKLPLTRPVYMQELGQRMGLPTREARRALRRIEHARKVKLLFDSRGERQGRLWTTEALIEKYCGELVHRPRRALGEVRQFAARVSEKIEEMKAELNRLESKQDQELSELRVALKCLTRRDHT